MSSEEHRIRLVALGGGGVGKSSIVKRFLFNTFCEKHRPTVEDLYFREYDLGTMVLKVDLLDTAGDLQFPAMRRLSIANASAILLVYSVDSISSFATVKGCFEEIREHKPDFQDIPIMVVGNKSDSAEDKRQVPKEDVAEWVFCELPRIRAKVVECSAKDNHNIKEIFRGFLQLAKIPLPSDTGLRRRSSAHASSGKSGTHGSTLSPAREPMHQETPHDTAGGGVASLPSRFKPRSRSLIRRTSKKVAKLKEAPAGNAAGDECAIS